MSGELRAGPDAPSGPLAGGLANAGTVVRRGVAVRRPAPPHADGAHRFLVDLRAAGFHGAPQPRRRSPDGWEELEFIQGDVAVTPYPWWSMTDVVLASVGHLLRRYHQAAAEVGVDRSVPWPDDLADPEGGTILCHDDVCIENVVFRDSVSLGAAPPDPIGGRLAGAQSPSGRALAPLRHRRAVALIDFDFAAPGRPVWDLAMAARYWVPILDPASAAVSGRDHLDPVRRVAVLVDAYGLDEDGRRVFVAVLEQATAVSRGFVAARVAAGEPGLLAALEAHGGWDRWDRIQSWLADHRARFAEVAAGR